MAALQKIKNPIIRLMLNGISDMDVKEAYEIYP